jgi:hypothetical protein
MKKILSLILIFTSAISYCQSNNYYDVLNYLKQNSQHNEQVACYGSSILVKAEYYISNNLGYAVMYIKQSDYDMYGKPYVYCSVPVNRWQDFKNGGLSSWGESFHKFIKPYTCNPILKNKNNLDYPQSSVNISLIDSALQSAQDRYNSGQSTYNYQGYRFQNTDTNIGEHNLNYKFGVGVGYNSEIYEILTSFKVGNKTSIQTQLSKFHKNIFSESQKDFFNKQYGISCIYNYNISFFSENLFFVTGVGVSFSKRLKDLTNTFENKFNPIFNLGLDYNLSKTPLSIGVHSRLDLGEYSNTGISLKYIYH